MPGDHRGSVSDVRNNDGEKVRPNLPGALPNGYIPSLVNFARDRMTGETVWLSRPQADQLLDQLFETGMIRHWTIFALGAMANHVHLVMGVEGDPDPDDLKRDVKAYASRRLNRVFGRRPHRTWWTEGGSARKLPDEAAVREAVRYVREQEHPLLIWINPDLEQWLGVLSRSESAP
jgi:REP element-mobilizing transposase RayT